MIGNYIFYILIRDNVLKHIQAPNDLAAFNDPDPSVHLLSNGGSLKEFRNVKNTSWYARNTSRYDTVSDVVESEVHQCQQNSDA